MKQWLVAALIVTLGACATRPVAPPGPSSTADGPQWQARQEVLEGLRDWRFTGRVGVTKGDDAWSGTVRWAQSDGYYDIVLTSPFGQGGVRLSGSPAYSELHLSDEEVLVDKDAEALLYRQFGWQLPVSGLQYWLLGLPSPEGHGKMTLDEEGRLEKLRQAGWEVDFRRYVRVNGMELPRKLYVSHPQLQVRLVVDRWELG